MMSPLWVSPGHSSFQPDTGKHRLGGWRPPNKGVSRLLFFTTEHTQTIIRHSSPDRIFFQLQHLAQCLRIRVPQLKCGRVIWEMPKITKFFFMITSHCCYDNYTRAPRVLKKLKERGKWKYRSGAVRKVQRTESDDKWRKVDKEPAATDNYCSCLFSIVISVIFSDDFNDDDDDDDDVTRRWSQLQLIDVGF